MPHFVSATSDKLRLCQGLQHVSSSDLAAPSSAFIFNGSFSLCIAQLTCTPSSHAFDIYKWSGLHSLEQTFLYVQSSGNVSVSPPSVEA